MHRAFLYRVDEERAVVFDCGILSVQLTKATGCEKVRTPLLAAANHQLIFRRKTDENGGEQKITEETETL